MRETPPRKISLLRQAQEVISWSSFLRNSAPLPQPERLSFSSGLRQFLRQRMCQELGSITAAGSGTLLGRGVSPAPPRCCVLSPWQPHCPHLPSAEGTLLQGCSRLGVILSCSGWINQEGFFFCTFCFSSAAMKRTNAEPPAWSCLRCWQGENSKGCFVWCLSGQNGTFALREN